MENQLSKREANEKLRKEREAAFFNYCLTIAETSHGPVSRTSLTKGFFQANGINLSGSYFRKHFNDIIAEVRTGQFSLEVQAKLFFLTGTPVSKQFLEELSTIAIVEKDGEERIKSFKSKISNLSFEGSLPINKIPRKEKRQRENGRFIKEAKNRREDSDDNMIEDDMPRPEEQEPDENIDDETHIDENNEDRIPEVVENYENTSESLRDDASTQQILPGTVTMAERTVGQDAPDQRTLTEAIEPERNQSGEAQKAMTQTVIIPTRPILAERVKLEEEETKSDSLKRFSAPRAPSQKSKAEIALAQLAQSPLAQSLLGQAQRKPQTHAPKNCSQDHLDDDEKYKNVYKDFFKGFYNNFLMNLRFSELDETVEKLGDLDYGEEKILDPSLVKSYFEVHIGELICQKIRNGDGYNLKKLLGHFQFFVDQSKKNPYLHAELLSVVQKQLQRVNDEDTVSHELITKAIDAIIDGLELQSSEIDRRSKERIPVEAVTNSLKLLKPLIPKTEIVEKSDTHERSVAKRKENSRNGAMEPRMKKVKSEPEDSLSSWSSVSRNLITGKNSGGHTQMECKPYALAQNIQDTRIQAPLDFAHGPLAHVHDAQADISPGTPDLCQGPVAQSYSINAEPNE